MADHKKPHIAVILGSTRKDRQGLMVAEWFMTTTKEKDMSFELLDLQEWPLPFFGTQDDPKVSEWQEKIKHADGFVIITPEYNHSFSAVLKNALDYGGKHFRNKPVSFVGYTAANTGAARAVEHLRMVAVELQMAPVREGIFMSGLMGSLPADINNEGMTNRLTRFYAMLSWWTKALQHARTTWPVVE